jgi:hypothetical protein
VFCSGCSKQNNNDQNKSHEETPKDRMLALAHQYDCSVLSDEVEKLAGSNVWHSIYIQRALKSNKRFICSATLCDLVQSDDNVEAIFEIENEDNFQFVAKLECPTNFISTLASKDADTWAIVFEPSQNHHSLNISQLVDGDEVVVVSGLIVEGKLVGLEKF